MDIRKQKRGLKKEVKAWWFRVVLTVCVCIVLLFIVVLLVLSYWCCVVECCRSLLAGFSGWFCTPLNRLGVFVGKGFLVGFAHPSTGLGFLGSPRNLGVLEGDP